VIEKRHHQLAAWELQRPHHGHALGGSPRPYKRQQDPHTDQLCQLYP
jgi:hypothetical protein